MITWRRIRKILRPLLCRRAVERELEEEIAFHIAMERQLMSERGMDEETSRRTAHVAFGGVERYKEQVRQARVLSWLDDLLADVRFSFRSIVRYRSFALAVIVTLALGIGGTTSIFSVVDALFLRTPPAIGDAGEMRRVYIVRDEGSVTTPTGGAGSWLDYEALSRVPAFAGVAGFLTRSIDLDRGEAAEQVRASAVSANWFDVLRVRPVRGRFFTAEEDRVAGRHPVAVISHALWQRRFGGSSEAVGSVLNLSGQPVTVIGVTPRGFIGVQPDAVEVWVPSAMAGPLGIMPFGGDTDWRTSAGMAMVDFVGRLSPAVPVEQTLAAGAAALARGAETEERMDPTPELLLTKLTAAAGPWEDNAARLSLWLALVAGVVLIIACVNVANLLLARAVARRRELALRLALGAGRLRLVRQTFTEALILALLGGAAGIVLAYWGSGLMKQFPLPDWGSQLDLRLLGFALGISLITGLLFGAAPALRAADVDPLAGIQDARTAADRSRHNARRALVAVQVTLSLVLLVGAGLFIRSLHAVRSIDAGVDVERLLVITADFGRSGLPREEREAFWSAATSRAAQLGTVEGAAVVHFAPFVRMSYGINYDVPGVELPEFEQGPHFNMAGPGYFAVAGVRVLEGREFQDSDRTGPSVLVVNRALADALAPGRSALGTCIRIGEQVAAGECSHVIGVVENYRTAYLEEARIPMMFAARAQNPGLVSWGGPALVVRTTGRADMYVELIRGVVQSARPDLPYITARPMTELIRSELLPFRLGATLFTLFGVLALVLAAVGLYGVLAYFVNERRREIGIRRSLGARAQNVVTLVIRQGMVPVATGMLLGLGAAWAGTRFISSLLFGVQPLDPFSLVGAALFLAAVALVAIVLPARRAAGIEPMMALREE